MSCTQLRPLARPSRHPVSSLLPGPSTPAKAETSRLGSLPGPLADELLGETRLETMEDIDVSHETLTRAIQDSRRVAAPERRPDEDRSRPVPPYILAKILEKNWLRRTWLVTRDYATKLRINHLQRQDGYERGK